MNNGRSRFSQKVMECKLEAKVSSGMLEVVEQHLSNEKITCASYIRGLIMKDRKIDEFGNPKK